MAACFDLCTVDDVKVRIDTGVEQTKGILALEQIIPAVSNEIEQYLRRWVTKTSHTEVFDINGNLCFFLKGYPVTSITSVHLSPLDWSWDTADIVGSGAYCDDVNALEAGVLKFLDGYLFNGIRALQVVYTGGIASDYADLANSREGVILKEAAILESAYRLRTRLTPGAESELMGEAGSVTWQRGQWFLREVEARLRPLRKVAP